MNLQASLKLEYFNSIYTSDNFTQSLWSKWSVFPSLSINYNLSDIYQLKLNATSNKIYPSYWEISPQMRPINSYSYAIVTPNLLPSKIYDTHVLWISKNKYIIMPSMQAAPNKFIQMLNKTNNELTPAFKNVNLNNSIK